MVKETKDQAKELAQTVIDAMLEKKGVKIVSLSLKDIPNAVCSYFVICHGTSRPQVEAIAASVNEKVKAKFGYNPFNKEGFENAEWILVDYVDVVVHIFREETRKFYLLEELWADAKINEYGTDSQGEE
jgi:ribosome-associated protein